MKTRYQALRGTRDILPGEVERWQFVERIARTVFERYGFREIRTPLIEATELFARSVGESTDIVRKEMYTFERGDDSVTLRPENTASVVRAFVEQAMHRNVAAGFPIRLYYLGPMFRYERPQKGRQRQFSQIGVEVLGADEPLADAETLEMLWSFLRELGVEGTRLVLNSVGDSCCRPAFRQALREWLEPRLETFCEDCRRRYEDNPLRVFDCKVEADQERLREAPTILDLLCADCDAHFAAVRRALDTYGIPYEVDARIVRGLDYYVRTVFEVTSGSLGAQDAVLGGGRYDGLVEALGGPAVPGFGFAIGFERLLMVVPDDRGRATGPDVALVALGAEGFEASVDMARRLRAAGLRVLAPLAERAMGAQLKRADRAGARFALFVGQDELARGRYGLKDLGSGEQTELDEAGVIARCTCSEGERDGQ
jgi:histidyl-tRNA synthetase